MKHTLFRTITTVLLLAASLARGASWVDSYWPLHEGDYKVFNYKGGKQLTVEVSSDWEGGYVISMDSPDGSGAEFHSKSGGNVYLTRVKVGWNNVFMSPPVLLFTEDIMERGGTVSTSTTVSQRGLDYNATFTVKVGVAGTVTVPAGTFSNCRSVSVTEKASIPGRGTVSANAMTAILAPDVGVVRKLVGKGVWADLFSGIVGGIDVGILSSGPPVVTISTPVPNQKIPGPAGLLAVSGTVSATQPGTQVFYKANDGDWKTATVNGSAWNGTIQMRVGVNTLTVSARDSLGRTSLDKTVQFQCVLNVPVGLIVIGAGSVRGISDGQIIETGTEIRPAAIAAKGYALAEWRISIGDVPVLATNRAVPFIMESNLVVTATFVDVKKPVLRVLAPKKSQQWSESTFKIEGTVKDNGPGGTVWFQLNGGAPQPAAGWSNWWADINLAEGTNRLSIYAEDEGNNRSVTLNARVIRTPPQPARNGRIR